MNLKQKISFLLVLLCLVFNKQAIAQNFSPNGTSQTYHALMSGLLTMGYEEHISFQFSGEEIYKKTETPQYLSWLSYDFIQTTDLPVLSAFSLGAEFHSISLDKEDYPKKKMGLKPRIKMEKNIYNLTMKFFFASIQTDPLTNTGNSFLQAYLGLGWGNINGNFNGFYYIETPFDFEKTNFKTSFNGLTTFRELAGFIRGQNWSIGILIRLIRANSIKVKDDIFNQKFENDEDLLIDMSAIANALLVRYTF